MSIAVLQDEGRKAGAAWANEASRDELHNLAGFARTLDHFDRRTPDSYSDAEHVYFAIAGVERGDFDREEAAGFWAWALARYDDGTEDDRDFLHGFINGAVEGPKPGHLTGDAKRA